MDEAGVGTSPARYRAFISYSHADSRFAAWLHRRLEAWTVPGEGRLAPIFIDRAELAAGPDLSASVREALAASAALIVIASPAARASHWVAQEVTLFRELHPDRPVLAALLDGEPGEAFPAPLLAHGDQAFEPLAADFREGRDGKRLALLKIIAGLTAQPLDRLVQRDAQARQRRVMWITAGALLLSLVLAALLVVALRARAEADRQRAEAEGMVEFMLTDLRDKLKGVGRLDVMDAVNQRAMTHYAASTDPRLPVDEALRRAKLLQIMGSDDLDRAGTDPRNSAFRAKGVAELNEAWRVTNTLLDRYPADAKIVFAHAQNEFQLGQVAFNSKDSSNVRDLSTAKAHFERYKQLALKLIALAPSNMDWHRELGFAEGLLCSVEQQSASTMGSAPAICERATSAMRLVRSMRPHELQSGLDLGTRLGWEADAWLKAGFGEKAIVLREEQVSLTSSLRTTFPDDTRALVALMLAHIGSAQTFLQLNRPVEAKQSISHANAAVKSLIELDPRNGTWESRSKQIRDLQDKVAAISMEGMSRAH